MKMRLARVISGQFGIAALASVLVALPAAADLTITVDGNDADWAAATACFSESSKDGRGGIELSRACLTNDNSSGDVGRLYGLFATGGAVPTNQDVYFGFAVDLDGDGQIQSGDDEAYAVVYPEPGSQWSGVSLAVFSADSYSLKRVYSNPANCGGTATSNGWSQAKVGNKVEISVSYGCIRYGSGSSQPTGAPLTYGTDNRRILMGVYPAFDLTFEQYYDGTTDALYDPGKVPQNATYPTVTARNGEARIFWGIPTEHEGTLVVRYAGPSWPSKGWSPSNNTPYSVGRLSGNLRDYTIVFAEHHGRSTTALDTGLSNGTQYVYKVFNHNAGFTYANGSVPVGNSGVLALPSSQTGGTPLWCFSTSASVLTQPAPVGGALYTAGNAGMLVALNSSNGDETWRPFAAGGAIQSRFPVAPLAGRSGTWIVTATQEGNVTAVSTSTGQAAWTTPGSVLGGNYIQAFPAIQLTGSSQASAAFKAANPGRDLIFIATQITGSTQHKVVALSSANGSVVWQSQQMSPVLGGMLVDYARDRLYVPTTSTGSGSLKILDTLTGNVVGSASVGPVTYGVVRDFFWNNNEGQAIVINDQGTAYGIGLGWTTSPTIAWQGPVGGTPTSFALPLGSGFVISVKNVGTSPGAVKRFSVSPGAAPSQTWSLPFQNPTPPWLRVANGYYTEVWVGSSDMNLYGVDIVTGTSIKQLRASSRPGMPVMDASRIYAGLEDGRICAWSLP